MKPRIAYGSSLAGKRGREENRPPAGERAHCAGKFGADVTAQRRVDLLEQDGGALRPARGERAAHNPARRPFRPGARVEVQRNYLRVGAGAGIEENGNLSRAAKERRGAVGGAGEIVCEDQDSGQPAKRIFSAARA
jgi:hypothetical protein